MQFHYSEIAGTGSYEWDTRGDIYSNIIVAADVSATIYVEVSNGGGVWVDHPGIALGGPNPCTDLAVVESRPSWAKTRVRVTASGGSVAINHSAIDGDR